MCKWLFHHNKGTEGIGIRSLKQNKGPCWDNINCHFRSEVEKMLLVWPMNWLSTPKDRSLLAMSVHPWGWWSSSWTFWMLSSRNYGPVKKTLLEGVITRYTPPITSSRWDNNYSWVWYFFPFRNINLYFAPACVWFCNKHMRENSSKYTAESCNYLLWGIRYNSQ